MTAKEVELTGGAPWGFRMHGGADQNQPLRISRVNPGRKASLSGIREGDIISSINGRPTKSMTNSDAHAMLRSSGPILRLGLNEDREMSPRRRSIGKGSELKRPSQLIAEVQKATPQAPVYATIRPSQFSHNRPPSSSLRSSLHSLPAAINSTQLVESVATSEEPPRFHPTNPFYTTLPSNHSTASKLPIPNGRASLSAVDRTKRDTMCNDYSSELKSPSFFTKKQDSHSSLPYLHHNENANGYETEATKSTANDIYDPFSFERNNKKSNQGLPIKVNCKNPFETKRNSDPFEKYLRPESNLNGKSEFETKIFPVSQSETNFCRNEEITKRSTITEHQISEVEEVKTIKKIILNGSGDTTDRTSELPNFNSPVKNNVTNKFEFTSQYSPSKDHPFTSLRSEHVVHTPTQRKEEYFSSTFDKKEREIRKFSNPTNTYLKANEYKPHSAEAQSEAVYSKVSKPPVKPDPAPAPESSPSKRKSSSPKKNFWFLCLYIEFD